LGLAATKTVAVDHVDFDFYEGEIVSIVGESGSGKTTLAKMLLGLINPTEGEIYFQGKKRDISTQKEETGILEKHSGDLSGSVLFIQYL
jgi:peptide/nickel transport system ATP-binding protein